MKQFDIKQFLAFACAFVVLFGCTLGITSCKTEKAAAESIAVFVPGVVSGSPVYEMLVSGAEKAVADFNAKNHADGKNAVKCTVIEAGTNQSEWSGKLTALASSGEYTMILSSNPSLPDLVSPLTAQFPNVKFILMDASMLTELFAKTLL